MAERVAAIWVTPTLLPCRNRRQNAKFGAFLLVKYSGRTHSHTYREGLPTCVREDGLQLGQRGVSVLSVGAARQHRRLTGRPGLLLGQRLGQRGPLGVVQTSKVHAEGLGEGPEGAFDTGGRNRATWRREEQTELRCKGERSRFSKGLRG